MGKEGKRKRRGTWGQLALYIKGKTMGYFKFKGKCQNEFHGFKKKSLLSGDINGFHLLFLAMVLVNYGYLFSTASLLTFALSYNHISISILPGYMTFLLSSL